MKLLVAEKPSVATQHYRSMLERCSGEKFIQKNGWLEGKDHIITWCVGHLVTLSPFDSYEGYEGQWQLLNLPLIPQNFRLMPIERTRKQLDLVLELMNRSDTLINGADAGREGNLIFDLLLDFQPQLKQKDVQRLWVNSYVQEDLDSAWQDLESAQERINLSYAARLRQRADWLVGLNATRAYTLTAGHGKLVSVGRVQTPTLNLIVNRDREVETFKELHFYGVKGQWQGVEANWCDGKGKVLWEERQEAAQKIQNQCVNEKAILQEAKQVEKRSWPGRPFDLTELQKEANKRFKIKVARVLEIAQELYEAKHITYPRTDSSYLPEKMKDGCRGLAERFADAEQLKLFREASEKYSFFNDEKVSDHYAIIPTKLQPENLSGDHDKVYQLIVERFVRAWMIPEVWNEHEAILLCNEQNFRIKLRQDIQAGHKGLREKTVPPAKKKKEDEPSNRISSPPTWSEGDSASWDSLEISTKKKSKPKYYTEAALLAAMKTAGKQIDDDELAEAMKERGLGTPATQAGIIETLIKRGFVEQKKNSLVSTEMGRYIIEKVDDHLKSAEMTGEWEFRLRQVEKGELEAKKFYDDIVQYVQDLFYRLQRDYHLDYERESSDVVLNCPACQKPLNRQSWGYTCSEEACQFRLPHTLAGRTFSMDELQELLEKKQLDEKNGFLSKRGFSFKAGLKFNDQWELEFAFAEEKESKTRKEKCPRCKGEISEGPKAVSCLRKECGFVIFKNIAGFHLREKDLKLLLKKKPTEVIDQFVSRKGDKFSARLELDSNLDTTFSFENVESGSEYPGKCPLCGKGLKQNDRRIFCAHNCGFGMFKEVAGRPLMNDDIEDLLNQKETHQLLGFKSKKGKFFNAGLKIDSEGKVVFNFEALAAPVTEFGIECPRCRAQLMHRRESVFCNSPDCGFVVHKLRLQKQLQEDWIRELLQQGRSPKIEGFVSPKGKIFSAYLFLDEEKNVKLDWESA